jgi:hypothetical protein
MFCLFFIAHRAQVARRRRSGEWTAKRPDQIAITVPPLLIHLFRLGLFRFGPIAETLLEQVMS